MVSTPRLAMLGIFALGCIASRGLAVELRSTLGEREVIRKVSFMQPIELAAPSVVAPGVVEEMMFDDVAQPCVSCGEPESFLDCLLPHKKWVKLEYLLWSRKGMDLPPLAITSSDSMNLNNLRLGLDTTTVLFGGETVGDEARPGGRLSIGMWLDDCENCAVEARFYSLGRQTIGFDAASAGATPLGRPFTNTIPDPDDPTSRTLAFPGFNADGSINVAGSSDLVGGDVLYRVLGCSYANSRLYLLAGYQYARIEEDLLISDSTVITSQIDTQAITDRFDTRNEYNAGEIGLAYEYYYDCWRIDLLAKVGFGNMKQSVTIAGTTTNNGIVVSPPIGLLAVDNQGQFSRNAFAVSPELGASANYALNDCIELSLGYSFIYWNNVAQAGDQIPANLDVPAPFVFNDGSYWVHGFNAGLEFTY